MKKPSWLNKKVDLATCRVMKNTLRTSGLSSVCEEARCPNISECFACGVATLMILGDVCTRGCSFCAIEKGVPLPPALDESGRVAGVVQKLKLSYVVVTSPTRDDLPDGGAGIFGATVKAVKELNPATKVEILIPDFRAQGLSLEIVADSGADVISHNIETVPALYQAVRLGSDYARSLKVLEALKAMKPSMMTKSGLMLGLGESAQEVLSCLRDLRHAGCDFLTLGQYLAPSVTAYPVKRYITQNEFDFFASEAKKLGFLKVKSSSYTRSSYLAHSFFE